MRQKLIISIISVIIILLSAGSAENAYKAASVKEIVPAAAADMEQETAQPESEVQVTGASRTLTEEEKLLHERMKYYIKSAYYSEIMDYWENMRKVTEISGRIEPLYESDALYLTKEMMAYDPPVVIHLAKNEIYARHGYIFRDWDLHNYFMGCIWYVPATAPEDFSDEVFNDYEKKNLKLLDELDTLK